MADKPLAKGGRDEEAEPAVAKGGSGSKLLASAITSLGAIFCATIIAIGMCYAATIMVSHSDPPAQPSPYTMIESGNGTNGAVVWRLNTMTGEMIACRSYGPAGIIPNDPSGAGCWRMGMLKQ